MLTDEFTHEIGKAFKVQTDALLAKQSAVIPGILVKTINDTFKDVK